MARRKRTLLTSVAALCATAAAAPAAPAAEITEAQAARWLGAAVQEAERISRCPATADDLVGETALRFLARHTDRVVDPSRRSRSYLRRSLRNAHHDAQARRQRVRPVGDLLEGADADVEPLPSHEPPVLHTVTTEEFRGQVRERDRRVLELLEEGHTDRRIATLLGRTRHEVRSSVARLRHAARRYFGDAAA